MTEKEIVELRHKLHANPDLSNEEYGTAEIIKNFIAAYNPTEIIERIGGAGLAAVYKFPKKGPTIAIRCELDALPIEESNTASYKSKNNGVSHKCGHDGHMAIVAGLAIWLNQEPLDSGTIVLLFQPAEETGAGAKRVIEDEKFIKLRTDYVFALHNIPKEPMHSVLLMDSGFSAEVQSVIIKVKGKESHASEPENGINPALGMSKMIQQISTLNKSDPTNSNFVILTPIHINMGQKSYGISPANGELHYTLRTWSTSKMDGLKSNLMKLLNDIASQHHLELELEWLEYFPASVVDKESNAFVRQAAQDNEFIITARKTPFKFGEDFGWFSNSYKTAMFGIGAGESTPVLHHTDYDFPDELIPAGVSMFKSIILNILGEN